MKDGEDVQQKGHLRDTAYPVLSQTHHDCGEPHKTGPINVSSQVVEGPLRSYSPQRVYWQLMVAKVEV